MKLFDIPNQNALVLIYRSKLNLSISNHVSIKLHFSTVVYCFMGEAPIQAPILSYQLGKLEDNISCDAMRIPF